MKKTAVQIISSKAGLAVALSRLKVFENPKIKLEQYPTDSEVAAQLLWNAHLLGDIEDSVIADLGCGTGILGIGALLLGAKKVFFVDKDPDALSVARSNIEELNLKNKAVLIESDIENFMEHVELVIQNPPFGTRNEHIDRTFLVKAFSLSDIIYSMHKESTAGFIDALAKDEKAVITHHWRFSFPLKATQKFHKRKIERIDVGAWRFERRH
jgi:putative methylase